MQQYFIEGPLALGADIEVNKEQSHHIRTVLRMKKEQSFVLVNETKNKFLVKILELEPFVKVQCIEELVGTNELPIEITIVQGLLKGEKWDWLIQKCCELGAVRIIPLQSKRCVVKLLNENNTKKITRWNKIALEACEQSKRDVVCEIREVVSFDQIKEYSSEVNIIAYEDASFQSESMISILEEHSQARSITIVIGPEGGFESAEVEKLQSIGYHRVSLGKRILRAETAAIAATTMIGFYYEAKN